MTEGSAGPSTDRHNEPAIDPTQNVLDLVQAAIQRQDDLREAESRHTREVTELGASCNHEIADLRGLYDEKLRDAESKRIDAIRAVDVGAVNRASEVSATQAATLATQVATSAEALRGQVEAARQQTASALAAALDPIQKDIADLRRAQYEQQGQKSQATEGRATTGAVIGYIAGAIGVLATIITLVVLFANQPA